MADNAYPPYCHWFAKCQNFSTHLSICLEFLFCILLTMQHMDLLD